MTFSACADGISILTFLVSSRSSAFQAAIRFPFRKISAFSATFGMESVTVLPCICAGMVNLTRNQRVRYNLGNWSVAAFHADSSRSTFDHEADFVLAAAPAASYNLCHSAISFEKRCCSCSSYLILPASSKEYFLTS